MMEKTGYSKDIDINYIACPLNKYYIIIIVMSMNNLFESVKGVIRIIIAVLMAISGYRTYHLHLRLIFLSL